jgi:DNA-binding ferritin-like protein (Dps family)
VIKKVEEDTSDYGQTEVDHIIKNYSGKYKSITKYSYYESSNNKWVKAVISIDGM